MDFKHYEKERKKERQKKKKKKKKKTTVVDVPFLQFPHAVWCHRDFEPGTVRVARSQSVVMDGTKENTARAM